MKVLKRTISAFLGAALCLGTISLSGCNAQPQPGDYEGFDEGEELITMWVHTVEDIDEGRVYKECADKFNEKYNGQYYLYTKFIPRNDNGGGYSDKVNAAVMSGGLPDVLTVDGPNISAYAANGIIQPLAELTEEERSVYLESILDQGTVNDKLYALGAAESSVGLFYNKEIVEKAGIEIPAMDNPWTWSEFYEVCAKVKTVLEDRQFVLDMTFPVGEATIFYYAPFVWANGGDFVSDDGMAVDGYFNDETVYEAVDYFKSLLNAEYFPQTKIDNLFELGRAAFKFDGAWLPNTIATSYDNINLGIAPYPVGEDWNGERYTPTGSWAFAVSGDCQNVEAATLAVQWMSGVESSILMSDVTNSLPSTYAGFEGATQFKENEIYKYLQQQLITYGHPRPKTPVYPQVSSQYQRILEDIVLGDKDPQETINDAVKRMETKLKRYQ